MSDDLRRLSIPPTPMSFGGYIASKFDNPLVFYGTVMLVSVLTGALVAWMLGTP